MGERKVLSMKVVLRNILFSHTIGNIYNELWMYAKQDSIICSALIGTVETAQDTRAGILSTFDQKVRMFAMQPSLMDLLSRTTFELSEVDRVPMAIFLILPDEKTGYHNLVSLFIKQSYEYIIFCAQEKKGKDVFQIGALESRLNYILDEFSSLPTIKDFPAMITAARSRNIRFTLFIQSKHQVIQRYKEEAETIQTNCTNWIFLTSREIKLLEEMSSLCGYIYEKKRPLLSVAALQRLDKNKGEVLLLCGRMRPCIAHLPDIDQYDQNQYGVLQITPRKIKELPRIEIRLEKQKRHISENIFSYDVDKMIDEINRKLKEISDSEDEESKNA